MAASHHDGAFEVLVEHSVTVNEKNLVLYVGQRRVDLWVHGAIEAHHRALVVGQYLQEVRGVRPIEVYRGESVADEVRPARACHVAHELLGEHGEALPGVFQRCVHFTVERIFAAEELLRSEEIALPRRHGLVGILFAHGQARIPKKPLGRHDLVAKPDNLHPQPWIFG